MTKRVTLFGHGKAVPLDREAKIRVLHRAKALMQRLEPGRAYGRITAKAFAVLQALLYDFHNARSGRCFPSYERIAEKARCARSTVAEAIKCLEKAGLLSWHNRITRIRLEGIAKVVRLSNAYWFSSENSKSETRTETITKIISFREPDLEASLKRFEEAFRKRALV